MEGILSTYAGSPLTGDDEWPELKVGDKVVRGPDWEWYDQDGGEGNIGVIVAKNKDHVFEYRVDWIDGPKWCGYDYEEGRRHIMKAPEPKPEWGIDKFEVGKWYVCNYTSLPGTWSTPMVGWLDGKPRECLKVKAGDVESETSAVFSDLKKRFWTEYWSYTRENLLHFREVPEPKPEWGIDKFEVGKWYVCNYTSLPGNWVGPMKKWLDGSPMQCREVLQVDDEVCHVEFRGFFGDWSYTRENLLHFREVPEPKEV